MQSVHLTSKASIESLGFVNENEAQVKRIKTFPWIIENSHIKHTK